MFLPLPLATGLVLVAQSECCRQFLVHLGCMLQLLWDYVQSISAVGSLIQNSTWKYSTQKLIQSSKISNKEEVITLFFSSFIFVNLPGFSLQIFWFVLERSWQNWNSFEIRNKLWLLLVVLNSHTWVSVHQIRNKVYLIFSK